ncbi:tetraacyldisaccharide 4'-kinase [Vibrio quintilis]|uniref:Tetraacyldisaccharide 4'-kinase n=1 Tax=Vibrio quintilis TaxID=1117707 RepID=A0A1M7Z1I7_9VIBR|nr:tetraacyldisaccharide 4'-kinase [Vibrio quintilis]SHO58817.1 Tetraacyldisaccharide 4'-kinase [Vibrio quintilis]
MIEKLWFSNHWLRWILAPVLWPLSLVYKYVSETRKQTYSSGRKPVYRPQIPIVIVGNITAGGNGKTPVVIWLVEMLLQHGMKPGVVSRGYGGKSSVYPLLLSEETAVEACGDEPMLIYQRTGVPVAVDPVRSSAVKMLLSEGVDIIITDDGLQHYALARDIEIVVVDGQRRFGNGRYIPYGPMRESVSRLKTVDFIINNGGEVIDNEIGMKLAPQMAVNLTDGRKVPVSCLANPVAFAGIGNPSRFFDTLSHLGVNLVDSKSFSDHQDFDFESLETFCSSGEHVIMTEKDAVKCRKFAKDNWWYLPVSATFHPADEQRVIKLIKKVAEEYGSSFA